MRNLSLQSLFMGLLAGFVGFASSFAVVLQGLKAVGANDAQAASGLMAAAISMGLCGILLSWRTKMPVSVAWSTPGAALLAISTTQSAGQTGGFESAVGAFIICGLLIIVCGLWKPFGKLVAAIPTPLASAMLAGILLTLCLAPFKAVAFNPALGLPIILAWVVGGQINRNLGVPAALFAFVLVVIFGVPFPDGWQEQISQSIIPQPEIIIPEFSFAAIIGIGLPLFVVTMASQNIPGLAVLHANNYKPKSGPLFVTTGVFSVVGAFFGAHAVNLAAITAAMLAGEESDPDRGKRYIASIVCGFTYILFGMFAGVTVAFVSLAPGILIEAVAGLALISAFSISALAAFSNEQMRPAAAVTFLASASGISLFGISGAFWGLLAGGAMLGLGSFLKTRT